MPTNFAPNSDLNIRIDSWVKTTSGEFGRFLNWGLVIEKSQKSDHFRGFRGVFQNIDNFVLRKQTVTKNDGTTYDVLRKYTHRYDNDAYTDNEYRVEYQLNIKRSQYPRILLINLCLVI